MKLRRCYDLLRLLRQRCNPAATILLVASLLVLLQASYWMATTFRCRRPAPYKPPNPVHQLRKQCLATRRNVSYWNGTAPNRQSGLSWKEGWRASSRVGRVGGRQRARDWSGRSAGLSGGVSGGAGDGSEYGYSAICAVGRDENRYVREWVEYHKCLGFSRIYLYDHNSTVPMSNEITDHIESGFVTYNYFPTDHTRYYDGKYTLTFQRFVTTGQGKAYHDCMARYSSRHSFIGFIDLDEFLVVYDPRVRHVDDLFRDYEQYGGLAVYWVMLGGGGRDAQSDKSVIDTYRSCAPHNHSFNQVRKSFVNTRFHPTMYSAHAATFGVPLNPSTCEEVEIVDENGVPKRRYRPSTLAPHRRVALYHYVTKSRADFEQKLHRGGGDGVTRPNDFYDVLEKECNRTCHGAARARYRFCGVPDRGYKERVAAAAKNFGGNNRLTAAQRAEQQARWRINIG